MKKLVLLVLLAGFLVGGTGCRLPFVDPPIVGRWKIMDEAANIPVGGAFLVFDRNHTAYVEVSFLGIAERSETYTWSYDREADILHMEGDSLQVEYNFLRTRATLIDMRSTLIFRL